MLQAATAASGFEPLNPDFREAVADCLHAQGFMRSLQVELRDVAAGYCQIALRPSDSVRQQYGFVHGGIVGALADTAGGCAALSLAAPGHRVLTVEYSIRFVRPASGSELLAEGQVIKAGRSLTSCSISVKLDAENGHEVCAFGAQTIKAFAQTV